MKLRGLALVGLWSTAMIAGAQSPEEGGFRIDLEKAHALSDGDMSQLPYFEECAETEYECGMIAGTVLRERKRISDAETFYRKALATGYKPAATSIASLHTRERNHPEGFAWSQLAYALDDPQQELSQEQMHRLASFRLLATNYQAMDEQQRTTAERRAREVVDEWIPEIHDKIQNHNKIHNNKKKREDAPLEIVKRVNPRYPRDLHINRTQGFALLYGQVDIEGNLVDVIAMDYSNRRFVKESIMAFSKWRFAVTDPDLAKPVTVAQRFEFNLE